MQKWLLRIFGFLLVIAIIISLYGYRQLKDRHPDYWLDLTYKSDSPTTIEVGFAAVSITPTVEDSWIDANGNAQFDESEGDTYEDLNNNGRFDPVWMAGFQNKRPAQGIHDELWARTMLIDNGQFQLAWIALDAIGYGNDDVIAIRKKVTAATEVDYVIVSSSHTHQGPDLIGMWGDNPYKSGIDPSYLQYVIDQSVHSLTLALQNKRPARLIFAQDLKGAKDLVTDSRKPIVMDPAIRVLHARDLEADTTLGTLIGWANHPETLWSQNLQLSSDFPHYVREGLEKGIYNQDTLIAKGLGGIAVYVNGSIGGLMTTLPEFPIIHPFSGDTILDPSVEKMEAQGLAIADLALKALADSSQIDVVEQSDFYVRARSIALPLDNNLYKLAAFLGIFERGLCGWWKLRSELCHWKIGPAEFLHHPSEIYPEIIVGGVETPEGGDFAIQPIEKPAIERFLTAKYQFVIGLSNDMIGYVIPKSQWDQEAPFTYENEHAPYGEINSLGPKTGPLLYGLMKDLLQSPIENKHKKHGSE